MLSTRGGGVGLWIWDSTTGHLARAAHDNVFLDSVELGASDYPLWLGRSELLLPASDPSYSAVHLRLNSESKQLPKYWTQAEQGRWPTASPLGEGVVTPLHHYRLLVVNVNGEVKEIGRAPAPDTFQNITWAASPDLKKIAYFRAGKKCARLRAITEGCEPEGMSIADIKHGGAFVVPLCREFVPGSDIFWSTDGHQIALLGTAPGGAARSAICVFSGGGRNASAQAPSLFQVGSGLTDIRVLWTNDNELLIHAADRAGASADQTFCWWRRRLDGSLSPIAGGSCDGGAVAYAPRNPNAAELVTATQHWLLASRGESWSLAPAKFCDTGAQPQSAYPAARFSVVNVGGHSVVLDRECGTLEQPSDRDSGAVVLAVASQAPVVVKRDKSAAGLPLWRSIADRSGGELLYDGNHFLNQTRSGEVEDVKYKMTDGSEVGGLLIKPVGYTPGLRYPVLVWIYPGEPPSHTDTDITFAWDLNLQIWASNGFAVLIPYVPLGSYGVANDPLLQLKPAVEAAVDRLIDLGVADPCRLFLAGHSFGGYAVYALITQTGKFKAAIASSGFSDLLSFYGEFDGRGRHLPDAPLYNGATQWAEVGQGRMGSPPWLDVDRYIRNSPVAYASRVSTPLLILHGDQDFINISQDEEMFTALQGLGVPSRFVRYWGEEHDLESKPNIADAWREMLAWVRKYDRDAGPNTSSAACLALRF